MSPRTVWTVVLHGAAAIALLAVLWRSGEIVSWVLVALLLALALEPIVQFLERHAWRRSLAVMAVMLSAVLLVIVFIVSFLPMLVEQARSLAQSAPRLLDRFREWSPFIWADEHFAVIARARSWMGENASRFTAPVVGALANVVHFLVATIATFFLTAFMLAFGRHVIAGALEWVPPDERPRTRELLRKMRSAVGGYVAGSVIIASIGGAVTTLALLIVDVPYFLPLGLAMALLGLIPFLGVVVGAVLVIGATLATTGVKAAIVIAIVFIVYQQTENHVLQPLVQRKTIKMNPLLIAVTLLVGTKLLGILGAVLALPIAGAAQVLLQDALERRQRRWRGAAKLDAC